MEHQCVQVDRRLFCECGRLLDPAGLRSVRIQGGTGNSSSSPRVRAFLNTGEPELLNPAVKIDGLGLD